MFHSSLSFIALLSVLPVSACQTIACLPKGPASLPPRDAPVVEAFPKQKAMREGQTEWMVAASPKDWLDVGVEWVAKDAATVQDNAEHLKIEILVDGHILADTMKYPGSPEPLSINHGSTAAQGSGIKYALFLPPLSKGEHPIVWHVTVETDMNDGWNDYPTGAEFTCTATVIVK